MDVTDWDSNYGESTQMLLKKTQIKTCCQMIIQRGGEFECFSVYLSFYKLFPLNNINHFNRFNHVEQ